MVAAHAPDDAPERCAHCIGRERGICDIFNESDFAVLAGETARMAVPSGRTFVEEGTLAHDCFVITSGRVKMFSLLPDGRRQISGFLESGDFLGLAARNTYAFGAEALGDVMLCRFPRAAIERLAQRFPALEHRLREEASRELVFMQGRVTLLGRKTAREKLASFLVERGLIARGARTGGAGREPPQTVEIDLPMSRSDIADYLGLTIETVSRVFGAFRREGLIAVSRVTHISIRNYPRLAVIADGLE